MSEVYIAEVKKSKRLPRNFHKSFLPERQYINALLRFAAAGREGDYQSIAEDTGIPMGSSSGKVPAILDYCRGMGLIKLASLPPSSIKRPILTPFGRVVFLEDPFLKTSISQWISHLNLCSPHSGADVWYHVFVRSIPSLGVRFDRSSLESYLDLIYDSSRRSKIGPLLGMYEDDAAFHKCGVLSQNDGTIIRKIAPLQEDYAFAYGAWLMQLMSDHLSDTDQVSTQELENCSGWVSITGWDIIQQQKCLELVESKGICSIDRHMQPWLLHAKSSPESAWRQIYDLLL